LAKQAGVPLSAVKYYQREGLIPAGERSAPNQVEYDHRHVQRIRLVRALLETGGLSVAAAKQVITVLDADDLPLAETFRVAQHAMGPSHPNPPREASRQRVRQLAVEHGWAVTDDNPGLDAAAHALDGLHAIGHQASATYLDAYATAAATAATADLRLLTTETDQDRVAELMVVGTMLGDPLFAGLRRLAQQNASQHLFPIEQKRDRT
jgi:DNA-binding transcriptional MerR regulator